MCSSSLDHILISTLCTWSSPCWLGITEFLHIAVAMPNYHLSTAFPISDSVIFCFPAPLSHSAAV